MSDFFCKRICAPRLSGLRRTIFHLVVISLCSVTVRCIPRPSAIEFAGMVTGSMKILHVISSVNPAARGPIDGIRQLGSTLERQGHRAEIVSLDPPDAAFLAQSPLRTYPLGPTRFHYGFRPKFVPWLRSNANRYDAVIVNGIWQFHSFGTWQALSGSQTPYVLFTHGMLDPWFKKEYPLKHAKKWMYWPWAEYRVLRDAS